MRWFALLDIIYIIVGRILGISGIGMNLCMMSANVLVWFGSVQGGKRLRRSLALFLFGSVLGLIFMAILENTSVKAGPQQFALEVCTAEEKLRYGESTGREASMGEYRKSGKVRLRVWIDAPVELYLKGFCGTVYQNGRWVEAGLEEEKYKMMENYLKKNGFYPAVQLSSSVKELVPSGQLKQGKVRIENVEASRKYLYIPYWLEFSGSERVAKSEGSSNNRRAPGIRGSETYAYTIYYTDSYGELSDNLLKAKPSEASVTEMVYRNYVYATCLSFPEELMTESINKNFFENFGGNTAKEIVELAELRTAQISDPFERAATAVLLFRYAGLPSRYVEGYYVNGKSAAGEALITDDDLTAWAEVYLDGIGFVPVKLKEKVEAKVNEEKKSAEDSISTGDIKSDDVPEKSYLNHDSPNDKAAEKEMSYFLWIAGICLSIAVLVRMDLLSWKRNQGKEQKFYTESDTEW